MTTILFENPIFLEHKVPEGHPERPDRLKALNLALEHEQFQQHERLEPELVDELSQRGPFHRSGQLIVMEQAIP